MGFGRAAGKAKQDYVSFAKWMLQGLWPHQRRSVRPKRGGTSCLCCLSSSMLVEHPRAGLHSGHCNSNLRRRKLKEPPGVLVRLGRQISNLGKTVPWAPRRLPSPPLRSACESCSLRRYRSRRWTWRPHSRSRKQPVQPLSNSWDRHANYCIEPPPEPRPCSSPPSSQDALSTRGPSGARGRAATKMNPGLVQARGSPFSFAVCIFINIYYYLIIN